MTADLFLKRALSVLALVAVVVGAYVTLVAPVIGRDPDALRIGVPGVLLAVWIATALLYPVLRRTTDRFVDHVILHRVDYRAVRHEIAQSLSAASTHDEALDDVCARLASALVAATVSWREAPQQVAALHAGALATASSSRDVHVLVPTNDAPRFVLDVSSGAGRRLMSDDIALLDGAAMLVGRRIDELRVSDERYERDLREQDMRRLATEAELRALRAQLNPHFLFNALTTVGHLITTSPSRAVETLYQLTALLRAVLRRTSDFVTLGEELQLVDAYLAIEKTRFEERLRIERDVPAELSDLLVPPLILQPIVENAVKHGISPLREGGTISIRANLESDMAGQGERLHLSVHDTGGGMTRRAAVGHQRGVGLDNVKNRLLRYYGEEGQLHIRSNASGGTLVELSLAVNRWPAAVSVS